MIMAFDYSASFVDVITSFRKVKVWTLYKSIEAYPCILYVRSTVTPIDCCRNLWLLPSQWKAQKTHSGRKDTKLIGDRTDLVFSASHIAGFIISLLFNKWRIRLNKTRHLINTNFLCYWRQVKSKDPTFSPKGLRSTAGVELAHNPPAN
jgi:hypothetical protein